MVHYLLMFDYVGGKPADIYYYEDILVWIETGFHGYVAVSGIYLEPKAVTGVGLIYYRACWGAFLRPSW